MSDDDDDEERRRRNPEGTEPVSIRDGLLTIDPRKLSQVERDELRDLRRFGPLDTALDAPQAHALSKFLGRVLMRP